MTARFDLEISSILSPLVSRSLAFAASNQSRSPTNPAISWIGAPSQSQGALTLLGLPTVEDLVPLDQLGHPPHAITCKTPEVEMQIFIHTSTHSY